MRSRLTGRYRRGDCSGAEKMARIRARYALQDYDAIYAYGDTDEDRQMLDMATKKYFRWQHVEHMPAASHATRRGDEGR